MLRAHPSAPFRVSAGRDQAVRDSGCGRPGTIQRIGRTFFNPGESSIRDDEDVVRLPRDIDHPDRDASSIVCAQKGEAIRGFIKRRDVLPSVRPSRQAPRRFDLVKEPEELVIATNFEATSDLLPRRSGAAERRREMVPEILTIVGVSRIHAAAPQQEPCRIAVLQLGEASEHQLVASFAKAEEGRVELRST
jgi:hypothetical protein